MSRDTTRDRWSSTPDDISSIIDAMFAEEEARFAEERAREERRRTFSLADDLPTLDDEWNVEPSVTQDDEVAPVEPELVASVPESVEVGSKPVRLGPEGSGAEMGRELDYAPEVTPSSIEPESSFGTGAPSPYVGSEDTARIPTIAEPEDTARIPVLAGPEDTAQISATAFAETDDAAQEPARTEPEDTAVIPMTVVEEEPVAGRTAWHYDARDFEYDYDEYDSYEEPEPYEGFGTYEEPEPESVPAPEREVTPELEVAPKPGEPEVPEPFDTGEAIEDVAFDEELAPAAVGETAGYSGSVVLDRHALTEARRGKRNRRRRRPAPRAEETVAEDEPPAVPEPEPELPAVPEPEPKPESEPKPEPSTVKQLDEILEEARRQEHPQPREDEEVAEPESEELDQEAIGRSTALMSALVIISRITGFFRTWGQAMALGVTVTASCYTVANNLPNQLYELVIGGMLATAFLPVYMSVKERGGRKASNEYTSNLLSIVLLTMGILTLLGIVFASPVVWTQSFGANADFDFDLAVYFFKFFSIEIVLYALSSVISGILNAERDYFWSNAAPIFNNLVCTSSFFLYARFVETNPQLAILMLALGNPLGVAIQVVMQWPSLKKHDIRFTPHINLHDPALVETLSIGIPSLIVTICSFVTVSVQTSSALSVTVSGSSIAYYTRIWYTLPYSIFAVPITTAMFTELSNYVSKGDMASCARGVAYGTSRIMFVLIPFALYLMVFSVPLITLMAAGKFETDQIKLTADYLVVLAASLPFYGVCTYQQKVCSSLRRMNLYMVSIGIGSILQVAFCLVLTPLFGLMMVPLSSVVFFIVVDFVNFASLRRQLGPIGITTMLKGSLKALVLGGAGAGVGALILWALPLLFGAMGHSAVRALVYTVVAGIPAVLVTFGLALFLDLDEVSTVKRLLARFLPQLEADAA